MLLLVVVVLIQINLKYYVKANAFVGSGALLTGITKAMVDCNVDIPDSAKSVNYASSGNATDSKLPLSGTLTGTLNGTVATFASVTTGSDIFRKW
jgi:hypothetical protein